MSGFHMAQDGTVQRSDSFYEQEQWEEELSDPKLH